MGESSADKLWNDVKNGINGANTVICEAAAGYMNQQVRDFVDGITADNLSDYFEIVKDYPVFTR